jgi:hypothetical protein
LRRLTNEDDDEKMPPPKSNRKLTAKQIETIRLWVQQGAKWGKHWSLIAPVRPKEPEVKDKTWAKNAIDRFVPREAREGKHCPRAPRRIKRR